MQLRALFPALTLAPGIASQVVTSIAFDSRKVEPGALFFALPGVKEDGLRFAGEAVVRGAVAIVAERSLIVGAPVFPAPLLAVDDVRAALAHAAAQFYPAQPATIAAITGTSGKTSVAAFLRQIWLRCGRQAASIGTIGVVAPSGAVYGSLTTPDPLTLHQSLARLAGDGVTHLAMEASSHGLDQRRLDGVRLSGGAFTNLSRDHLDYHATLEDYFLAKTRLFNTLLHADQPVVLDADSDVAERLTHILQTLKMRVFSVGRQGDAMRLVDRVADGLNSRLRIDYDGRRYDMLLPLAGAFQAANAMVAAGLALATGEKADAVFAAVEKLEGAPGRLELIGRAQGAGVFVDYAHKPAALQTALEALRPFARGRLIVVFGCGGDRDRGKRPMMGEIAARDADIVIVTDDNPRSENPEAIRQEILEGARSMGNAHVVEIADRGEAIAAGIALLQEGDILLIAGKGHETGQIIGSKILPFSDHGAARDALARKQT